MNISKKALSLGFQQVPTNADLAKNIGDVLFDCGCGTGSIAEGSNKQDCTPVPYETMEGMMKTVWYASGLISSGLYMIDSEILKKGTYGVREDRTDIKFSINDPSTCKIPFQRLAKKKPRVINVNPVRLDASWVIECLPETYHTTLQEEYETMFNYFTNTYDMDAVEAADLAGKTDTIRGMMRKYSKAILYGFNGSADGSIDGFDGYFATLAQAEKNTKYPWKTYAPVVEADTVISVQQGGGAVVDFDRAELEADGVTPVYADDAAYLQAITDFINDLKNDQGLSLYSATWTDNVLVDGDIEAGNLIDIRGISGGVDIDIFYNEDGSNDCCKNTVKIVDFGFGNIRNKPYCFEWQMPTKANLRDYLCEFVFGFFEHLKMIGKEYDISDIRVVMSKLDYMLLLRGCMECAASGENAMGYTEREIGIMYNQISYDQNLERGHMVIGLADAGAKLAVNPEELMNRDNLVRLSLFKKEVGDCFEYKIHGEGSFGLASLIKDTGCYGHSICGSTFWDKVLNAEPSTTTQDCLTACDKPKCNILPNVVITQGVKDITFDILISGLDNPSLTGTLQGPDGPVWNGTGITENAQVVVNIDTDVTGDEYTFTGVLSADIDGVSCSNTFKVFLKVPAQA